MELTGQHTPVVVRVTPGPDKERNHKCPPLELVEGFRRREAIACLFRQGKGPLLMKPGEIRCIVHLRMGDREARERNLRENVLRESITACDFVFAIRDLVRIDRDSYSAARIAGMFGVSTSYASTTLKVATSLRGEIFEQWRTSKTKPLGLAEILNIASHPPDLQPAAYAKAAAASEEERHARANLKSWFVASLRRAQAEGRYLGILHREGVLKVQPDVDWVRKLRFLTRLHKCTSLTAQERIAQVMSDAFLQASKEERTEEEEEREEEWDDRP